VVLVPFFWCLSQNPVQWSVRPARGVYKTRQDKTRQGSVLTKGF
jgi:hypothetical protein